MMTNLVIAVLKESRDQYCARTLDNDAKYIASRFAEEGESFFTLTLPRFAADFMKAVERGVISQDLFPGFRREGKVPKFLGGLMGNIFDKNGVFRADADDRVVALSMYYIRQVCLLYSKTEVKLPPEVVDSAIQRYVDTDMEIPHLGQTEIESFQKAAFRYFSKYLCGVSRELAFGEVTMRHSSGALATRESYNQRFSSNVWSERLQEVVPFWDYLTVNWHDASDQDVKILSPGQEPPAKVTTVPKTAKGPRIIAMEPVYKQYVQQGILRLMRDELSKFPLLSMEIGWETQEVNRHLAQIGSVSRSLATIDLSDASDRVSLQLVEALPFGSYLLSVIKAARSEFAQIPDGRRLALRKFASMGSSLCFPIETMVFYTIARMVCEEDGSYIPPSADGRKLPSVRVYGDDIIVPCESARSVISRLEAYGLKVNTDKTYLDSKFRESCGADWYGGYDVSITRVRRHLPSHIRQTDALVSSIALHNLLFSRGLFGAASNVKERILSVDKRVPDIPFGHPGLGLFSYGPPTAVRFNTRLHRHEVRVMKTLLRVPKDRLEGYGALRKFFLMRGDEPLEDGHLEFAGRVKCAGMTDRKSVV